MTPSLRRVFLSALTFTMFSCGKNETQPSNASYFGADNQQGQLEYTGKVEMTLKKGITLRELMAPHNRSKVEKVVKAQSQFLSGVFTEHDAFLKTPGAVYGTPEIKILSAAKGSAEGLARITYKFKDKAVFKNAMFRRGETTIKFILPRNPFTIFDTTALPIDEAIAAYKEHAGYVDTDLRKLKDIYGYQIANLCSNFEFNDESDFWYYWNPSNPGCKIQKKDVFSISAKLTPLPSTSKTYPYYDRLLGDNGNGRTLSMMFLIGIDMDFSHQDFGRKTFEEALERLLQIGFKLDHDRSRAREKYLKLKLKDFDAEVDLLLMDPDSEEYAKAGKRGMEAYDVFINDGHSGLGAYLGPDALRDVLGESLKLNKKKSQIFFFNGCSTYPYYNKTFFDLKATPSDPTGSKNLDIVTTTIGASFRTGAGGDIELIDSLVNEKRPSWQQIVRKIYQVKPEDSALTQVNGDEDNPLHP